MDWHAAVGILAGLMQVVSVVPYVKDMIRGTTRPNVVTHALWGSLSVIGVAAQISAGASWSVLILIAVTINEIIIVTLALTGYGYSKYGRLDWASLALGIVAIAGWQVTENPLVALVLVMTASLTAALPTIVKTYREPASEHPFAWFLVLTASSLAAVSTQIVNVANLIFPVYQFFESATIWSLAFFGQRFRRKD